MAQTGDPTGKGDGGSSIFGEINGNQQRYFPAEIRPHLKHQQRGTVSMAVSNEQQQEDPESGGAVSGSQFFITLADGLDYLDGKYTVFGQVAEGWDVLDKLNEAYCDAQGRPYRDIRIRHTVVLDDPFDDPEGLQVPDASPVPTKEQLESIRIGEEEDIEEDGDIEEMERRKRAREAKAQALTLEMVGDLPFAEVRPPENILFVCKLNPVTRDEDLELIFSRFGRINSCEIIRDRTTGESLSYAFIEFDEKEHAEEAYFKMQSVLIDDRRIHVDFSQSVSKLHKDWISKRMQAGAGQSMGGFDDLQKRTRYRTGDSKQRGENYELVFDDNTSKRSSHRSDKPSSGRHHQRRRSRSPNSSHHRSRHRDRSASPSAPSDYNNRRDYKSSSSRDHQHHHRSDSDRNRNKESDRRRDDRDRRRDSERRHH
ncbi:unnamed protein product [Absidia cylindrospora]